MTIQKVDPFFTMEASASCNCFTIRAGADRTEVIEGIRVSLEDPDPNSGTRHRVNFSDLATEISVDDKVVCNTKGNPEFPEEHYISVGVLRELVIRDNVCFEDTRTVYEVTSPRINETIRWALFAILAEDLPEPVICSVNTFSVGSDGQERTRFLPALYVLPAGQSAAVYAKFPERESERLVSIEVTPDGMVLARQHYTVP